MRGIFVFIWFCLLVLLSGGQALGQSKADLEKAAKLFEEAETAYRVQEYEKALEKFKAAYYISPRPELLFSIAQCQRLSGQNEEALISYRSFLQKAPDSSLAQSAKERITELEGLLVEQSKGKLSVTSSPEGASIFVDGELKGSAPVSLNLLPGKHQVFAEKDGYFPVVQEISLVEKQDFKLEIPMREGPPGYLVPAAIGGASALVGGAFLFVFSRREEQDFPKEGALLRSLALTADLGFLATGATAAFIFLQHKKADAIRREVKP